MPNVMMNSLVSATKIVTDDLMHPMLANLVIPEKLPVACLPPPVSVIEEVEEEEVGRNSGLRTMDQDVPLHDSVLIEKETLEPIDVEEEAPAILHEEPMEECANTGSPKQPSSLKSEDVVMAENLSVRFWRIDC